MTTRSLRGAEVVERIFEAVYEHEVAAVEAERQADLTVREE